MSGFPELKRPLPSFRTWLESEDPGGERGDGFGAFVDLAERTLKRAPEGLTDNEASLLGMPLQGLMVATVECCNIEAAKGRSPEDIIVLISRVLGLVAMYSVASVVDDDAPYRRITRVLIEEFRFGVKETADDLEEHRERDEAAERSRPRSGGSEPR